MIQKRSFQQILKSQFYTCLLWLVVFAGLLIPGELLSQGMTRVNIVGVPSVLSSPYADQLEADFRNGKYQVVFNYTNAAQEETDFVFDFEVFKEEQRLLNITSDPVPFRPGTHTFTAFFEEIPFETSPDEVVSTLTNRLKQQIVMAGTLPEGQYQVRIQARPADGNVGMTNQQGVANFSVRYPQPPTLVTPPDGANVMQQFPTFSWTQVRATDVTTFKYELLVVEVLEGQNPSEAILSNRAHHQTSLTGQTTIPYQPEFQSLEEGVTYAWQIRAADVDERLPVRNEGRSEVFTFTYGEEAEDEDQPVTEINELEIIPLIPEFASLVNLVDLEIDETSDAYRLQGNATLRLQFDGQDALETSVNVQNLRLQKESLDNPVILDGSLTGNAPDLAEIFGQTAGFVRADEINWSLEEGVTTTAEFEIPDGENLSATGELTLQRLGPVGSIQAESEDVLKRLGAAPFQVSVTSMSANYPEGIVTAGGFAETFGNVRCDLPSIPIGRRSFTARVDCEVNETFSLLEGSDKIRISIGDITGQFGASWFEPVPLSYNLGMGSSVELKLDQPQESVRYCGAKGRLNLSAEDGLQAGNFRSDCPFPEPTLNLGILKLSFQNPDLAFLDYSYELGWNFEFQFDANLFLPSVPEAEMPVVEDVTITPEGIQFPDFTFNEEDLQPNNTFELDSFQFSLNRFTLEESLFPWFEWDETGVGPWEFSLDAGVQFPDSNEYPDCLRNSELNLNDAGVSGQSIEGDLQTVGMEDCRWEFGAGYALQINQAGGELQLQYEQEELHPQADLDIDGVVELGEPFTCDNAPGEQSVDQLEFLATSSGFDLQADDFVPECPVQIGPYKGQITSSELQISQGVPGDLTAEISGSATLNLGEDQSASGTFTLNPVTGEFSELDFNLQGPFEWGIPKQNSVLVFRVDEATLDENGISIDGRQSLLFEDETMGVTFDELLVDWQTFEVQSGRIILDEQFSLEAGIDPDTHQLDFSATLRDSSLTYSPGVLMTLAGTIIIDSDGVNASGASTAELNFKDLSLDDLEIIYSNDFAMRLDPFGVQKRTGRDF
ncbi:MAG: hypothetical protein U5K72_15170 [Balneolaceae bacterium]|nr:hypothetical protein [Balneolaceae bacterium]